MKSKDELEGSLSKAASDAAMWRSLLEHPGWVEYQRLVEGQINLRKGTILLTPLQSAALVFHQEFMKGEAAGAQACLLLPHAQLEAAEMDRVRLTNQLERDDEIERQVAADEPRSRVDVGDDGWHGE